MSGILVRPEDEPVMFSAHAAQRLLERGDGDAALLYLALVRHAGMLAPRALADELRWSLSRVDAAEQVLRELDLIRPEQTPPDSPPRTPLDSPDECPAYRQEDIALRLEDNLDFEGLADSVEKLLGKKLTTPELSILLGLYEHLGLPSYVILQLVNHCREQTAARYGAGRRPTLRQIEREGFIWARMGVDTQAAVTEYLRRYTLRQQTFSAYMRVLRLGNRLPVDSEEKYLKAWQEWGFPAESVELAYDKTVLRCHEFRWPYCNGILRRWHQDGFHTPAEITAGDRPHTQDARCLTSAVATDEEIRKYAQELRRGRRQ